MSLTKTILCLACWIFIFPDIYAQRTKDQELAIVLKRQIEQKHFRPKAVNDSFSSAMFLKIIEELDPQQTIFTADDYAGLSLFRNKLDDEMNGSEWKFLNTLSSLYKQRLQRADSIVETILQKPLDVNADDKITFAAGSQLQFAQGVAELRTRWTKWFKYLMLHHLYDLQEADSTKPPLKTLLAKNEAAVRDKMKKVTHKGISEMLSAPVFDRYVRETYFNALATTFDPHTMFLSPEDKEDFESQLSTENYSFGFEIDETREGKIVIAHLVPGGPAWKSGELHANDELLQLQWEGRQVVDISNSSYEEVDDVLNESNEGTMLIKVRKSNGAVRTVKLQKEKIETEENVVKGYLLKGEKNVGYISLPDFYTTWEDESGSGCANDLAKEIIRLKKENIDGLILDVRFNGGGSLDEALQLAGIFIDIGPLTGTKDKSGKLVFLRDPNRGTVYDGPLVLLVNGQSASASELLAAALQDYNRAVIVGSPTYGKATMQQVFPMDTLMKNPMAKSANGYVKITTGKLYRVNGQTAQLNGVLPDVYLPDAFDALEYGEKFDRSALPPDTVNRNTYYTPLKPLPIAQVRQLSDQRINNNKNFQEIKEGIRIQSQRNAAARVIPLQLELFEKWAEQEKKEEIDEHTSAETSLFVSANHKDDVQQIQAGFYGKAVNDIKLKNIRSDIYIEEAYQIIIDLLKLQPKN